MSEVALKVERIYRMDADGALKAFADVSIGGAYLVKGVRILSGTNGLFARMPMELGKDGKWYETVRPMNKEARDKLYQLVLSTYEE